MFPLFAFFCRVLRVIEFNMDGVSGTGFEGSVDLQPRFQWTSQHRHWEDNGMKFYQRRTPNCGTLQQNISNLGWVRWYRYIEKNGIYLLSIDIYLYIMYISYKCKYIIYNRLQVWFNKRFDVHSSAQPAWPSCSPGMLQTAAKATCTGDWELLWMNAMLADLRQHLD